MSKKNWVRYFEIRKYTFLNYWKVDEQKNCARYFEIRKHTFFKLIFEKGMRKKLCQYFEIRKYTFLSVVIFQKLLL